MDTVAYPMFVNREGYVGNAIIFVMHKFREMSPREGAFCELDNLKKIAGLWSFKPCLFLDATENEITDTLKFITNPPEERPSEISENVWQARILDAHNAILVAVVSHGNVDCFLTADEKYFPDKQIYFYLNENNCRIMRGKPKIILFNKCRIEDPCVASSDLQDSGEHERYDVYFGDRSSTNSNFLKIYSCARGTYSLRDTGSGSFFLSALPREYEAYGGGKELRKFLQIFRSRILKETNEKLENKTPAFSRYAQCPTLEDSLLAEIFFPQSCGGLEEMEVEPLRANSGVGPTEAWGASESSDTPATSMSGNAVAPETRQDRSKFLLRLKMYKKVQHAFRPVGRRTRFRRFIFSRFR